MDNINFYFYLAKILELIACEFFGLKNVMFILLVNEKLLGKVVSDY